jgi:hypothetical protein
VAHLFTLEALLSFGAQVSGYPLSRVRLRLHGLAAALSLIGIRHRS